MIEILRQKILKCSQCSLAKFRKNVVFGEGNLNANIVFLGEAPGKKEDLQGKPFQGRAGKVLDELLFSISLKREDIFITNVVKCRPPNNRNPLKSEISLCLPYLKKQLNLISPKILVCLGNFALKTFFPDKNISEVNGQVLVKDNFKILALYHPAASLYNPKLKETLKNDFLVLKDFI
jgi:DNA polymerase